MMMLRLLPWALWLGMVALALGTFAGLPEEIPRHIGAAGKITRSVPTTLGGWLLLPIIAGATQLLLSWISVWVLPRRQDLFNIPDKDRLMKLPPSYRASVVPQMQMTLDAVATCTMVTMCVVQVMLWRAAMGERVEGWTAGLIVGTVLIAPIALILTSKVSDAVAEAERRWKAAGSPTEL
jgi:uncharacterized membrane protein